jgi:hypothetical protein
MGVTYLDRTEMTDAALWSRLVLGSEHFEGGFLGDKALGETHAECVCDCRERSQGLWGNCSRIVPDREGREQ